jgi:hypothetical protein
MEIGVTISTVNIVVRDEEPIAATVDSEIVILSAKAEAYFGLGEIGSVIWGMIANPCRISDICAQLVKDYDVDQRTCERDTIAFLTKLLQDRLIYVVEENPKNS